jgi:hypothetical protein
VGTVAQNFALTVTGAASQLSISPANINFGDVYLFSLPSAKVTVQGLNLCSFHEIAYRLIDAETAEVCTSPKMEG